jgi:hypothetical protein
MFKHFSEIDQPLAVASVQPACRPLAAESLARERAPAIGEVTFLKAEIARREAALGKEHACEHINLLRVKRLTREIKLLRRRLLMLCGGDGPQTRAA